MPSVTPGISQRGLEIVTIPCLSDNYAYLVKGPDGVCLIDAPEAGPIIDALEARGWTLGTILITHHHHDHVGGVEDLRRRYGCEVMGPEAERDKLPPIDMGLKDGDAGGEGPARTVAIAVPATRWDIWPTTSPRRVSSSPPTASWRWDAGGCSRVRPR
jgi:glyoxylase-like metal-dependent hydrolase (beta-lactamase superfamily II)